MKNNQAKENIYLTTTLPYVNARAHIGHALEFVQADVVARSFRLCGHNVFFNTGTDEHGQKIHQAAAKEGKDIKAYVDHYAAAFEEALDSLNITNDAFIRTTDETHIKAAQEMWKLCNQNGDIYKEKFTGLYCVGCEMFITEKDLVEGNCPHHNYPPEAVEAENYFFRFSRYEQPLLDYLKSDSVIIPEHHRQWAIDFVTSGLKDFSISREKKQLAWGVPVPDDDDHVMYVWFDALTNYISTLGWGSTDDQAFQEFWQAGRTFQFAGKDQIRMQSLMWQAMLISAGIQPTDQIFYHGFINSAGQKMSKSIGNVIDPLDLANEYGTDAVRYYLLRHIHPSADSDLTLEKFHDSYTAHLVNGLGNLTSRIITMALNYKIDYGVQDSKEIIAAEEFAQLQSLVQNFKFSEATDWLWLEFNALDEYITHTEPFKTIKTNEEKARADVAYCAIRLHELSVMLQIFLPETAEKIMHSLETKTKPDSLFPRK